MGGRPLVANLLDEGQDAVRPDHAAAVAVGLVRLVEHYLDGSVDLCPAFEEAQRIDGLLSRGDGRRDKQDGSGESQAQGVHQFRRERQATELVAFQRNASAKGSRPSLPDQRLERVLVDSVALENVDASPRAAVEAGVE